MREFLARSRAIHDMKHHVRIARPVSDLARSCDMYCHGLGLRVVGSFEDHDGFDGVMLAFDSGDYHFEFTHWRRGAVLPQPTPEDLVVLYVPSLLEWQSGCRRMVRAGFKPAPSFNPYWDAHGRTYEDPDGYRTVLHQSNWSNAGRP
jgi:catechol 2,3-dioxygenase-like lactoylglutathione lyase family enzyme